VILRELELDGATTKRANGLLSTVSRLEIILR
jgi:hypothetical protein